MKIPKVVELMRRWSSDKWVVRLWLDAADLNKASAFGDVLTQDLNSLKHDLDHLTAPLPAVNLIDEQLRPYNELLSAFELTDRQGNGIVIYYDWP